MARTSKRHLQTELIQEEKSKFRAGIYTRLSNERKEEWRSKSFSIETQTIACKEYALKENIDIVEVYTDYEYSGTNFERPSFIKMMDDIKSRRINCIIIRDLSRLGREYLEMGRLIDKVFPFLGVRFISVNDKLDTLNNTDSKKSFEVTLKNIINDLYAKDISVKIKSAKENRARNGYFIGSVPPFGYKVVKLKEGQKLDIDENTCGIAREMFDLTLKGHSQFEVAKIFNTKGYTTPMVYYKTGRLQRFANDPEWHKGSISKMLINPVYTGKLVQGVKQQNLAKGIKQHFTNKDEYIVYENAHEPIITEEEHQRILEGRKERKDLSFFARKPHDFDRDPENRYKGKIFSSYSGKELYRRLVIYGKNKDRFHYIFRNERSTGKLNEEPNIHIAEKMIDEKLSEIVRSLIASSTSKERLMQRVKTRYTNSLKSIDNKLKKLEKKVDREEVELKNFYEKYKENRLSLEKYRLKREVATNHINNFQLERVELEDKYKLLEVELEKSIKWIENLYLATMEERLSKDLIEALVEKIIVKNKKEFEIVFTFSLEEMIGGNIDE